MKKTPLVLPALVLTISCSSGTPPADIDIVADVSPQTAAPASIPDSDIGLAAGTAFDQPEQPPIAFNQMDPGESELRARPNAEFPPPIPHSVEDLETITLTENSCLECHDRAVAVDFGAVAVPVSHHVDLRRTPDATGERPVGAHWVCTSCHVAQTDTEPLVANPTRP